MLQNYRDYIAMGMIGSYMGSQFVGSMSRQDDNDFVTQHCFTDDESDMTFRETTNKTDGAMRRKIIVAYSAKIHAMRAEKERAA